MSDLSARDFAITLLDHGADAREFYPKTIATQQISVIMGVMMNDILETLAKQGLVRKLLECGAREDDWSPDKGLSRRYTDLYGWGPLYAAIEQEELEIAEMLLKKNTSGFVHPEIEWINENENFVRLEITPRFIPWDRWPTWWDEDTKERWYRLFNRFNIDMDGKLFWQLD